MSTATSEGRPRTGGGAPDWHFISAMAGEGEWGRAGNGICAALRQLFESLPDVYLFAKDLQGRFTFCNRIFAEKCGFRRMEDILGKTDFDVFEPHLAEKYVNDDALVLCSGKPIFDAVELVFHVGRSPAWYSTTKVPICGEGGRIVGLVGYTRDFKKLGSKSRSYIVMEKVVDHVMENYSSSIQIETLANLVCLSISQFERKFKSIFGVTPMKYINMVRVQAACQSLAATDALISQISIDNGFYDLSHFNRQFRAQTGMSPSEYRKKHAVGRSLPSRNLGQSPVRMSVV